MLKGIPGVLSPDLLKVLMEMGHTDEIVIADGNFPGASLAKRLIRLDGHSIPEILEAVLQFFPLDTYDKPVYLMEKVKGDTVDTPIWDTYKEIVAKHTSEDVVHIDKWDFYERTKKAYAVVMTSEKALYANILLKKGVV